MENFTFPTEAQDIFEVADRVNVTWTVIAPIISLYERCGTIQQPLEGKCLKYCLSDSEHIKANPHAERKVNEYSYVWTATRNIYRESGCNFVLQPFTERGEAYGDNITSVAFGVSKRYTGDPAPKDYNFANTSSTDSNSTTTSTSATGTSPRTASPSSSTSIPNTKSSHGLSESSKIGIGLGVPLGVLLVATAIVIFIIYRRKAHRNAEKVSVANMDRDGLAALPVVGKKDSRHGRLSQTETLTSFSQMSNDNRRSDERDRPLSELMSTERVEMP
jgi:hypothetical protein